MGVCCGNNPDENNSDIKKNIEGKITAVKQEQVVKSKLVLHGDMIDTDTRTIRCILDLCEIEYDFKEVNTLKGEHQSESYTKICPL